MVSTWGAHRNEKGKEKIEGGKDEKAERQSKTRISHG